MMSWIVTFLNEINVMGCDGLVDIAHGLGEPHTPVSLSLLSVPHVCLSSCLRVLLGLHVLLSSYYFYTYDSMLQMDSSNVNDNSIMLFLS